MKSPRQFLICESAEHADLCDQFVFAFLVDTIGAQGNRWSGVYALPGDKEDKYAILWGPPVAQLFGTPFDPETGEGDKSMVVVTGELTLVAAKDEQGKDVQILERDWVDLPEPELESAAP